MATLLSLCRLVIIERVRRYDEAIRLLQVALPVEAEPVPIQFDLALVLLAASGNGIGYEAAITAAAGIPVLRRRGIYYIALFDLIEALRENRIPAESKPTLEILEARTAESGVGLSKVKWLLVTKA